MNRSITAAVLTLCATCALATPEEDQALAAPTAPQSAIGGDPTEPEINIVEQAEGRV